MRPNSGHCRAKHGPQWLQCILRANITAHHYFCPMAECWSREWVLIWECSRREERGVLLAALSLQRPQANDQSIAQPKFKYGSNFLVSSLDGATISSVVLIRSEAVTHFFDENERFVPLKLYANFRRTDCNCAGQCKSRPTGLLHAVYRK
jgi:hypothetical protein